jgi:multiple sugar transport system ATP-binding protein
MRDGRVEQAGAPMALYNDPATAFVAGFIGSPRMNFLQAAALGEGGHTLGVRPEHLALARGPGPVGGAVSHVEKLGAETLVYVRAEPHGLVTVRLVGEHDFAVGEPVHVTPDPARTFRFDEAGARLR